MKKTVISLLVIAVITLLAVKAAYIERGYFAVGAEWFLWIWPVLFWSGNYKEVMDFEE